MTLLEILARCRREIRASSSVEMLMTAYKYYRLFFVYMMRKGVPNWFLKKVDKYVMDEFRKKKRTLE